MRLDHLTRLVARVPELTPQLKALQSSGGHLRIDGLAGIARSLVIAALAEFQRGPTLVITYQQDQADRLCDDLRQLVADPDSVYALPAQERDPVLRSSVDYAALSERMGALAALASPAPSIVVATPESVLQRAGPPRETMHAALEIGAGAAADIGEVTRRLVGLGYVRTTTVTAPGQFARRGGIVDVFSSGEPAPVRLEWFGDEIESVRTFDTGSQRSTGSLDRARILPVHPLILTPELGARAEPRIRAAWDLRRAALLDAGHREAAEALDDRIGGDLAMLTAGAYFDHVGEYLPFLVTEPVCALDYLMHGWNACAGGDAAIGPIVALDDPSQMEAHWTRKLADRASADERLADHGAAILPSEAGLADLNETSLDRLAALTAAVQLSPMGSSWPRRHASATLSVHTAAMESFRSRMDFLKDEVARWLDQGASCVTVTGQPQRTREILTELGIPLAEPSQSDRTAGMAVLEGRLRQGLKFDEARLYIITDRELYGTARPVTARRRATGGIPISTLLDLREGDYVVHVAHGIGIYRGLVKRVVDGAEKDYIFIQYAGPDRLYVPADQIDRVQRYVGTEGSRPSINRMLGHEWQRTTRRVKEQARDLARDLVELYAAREAADRPVYGEDSPWQAEMEDAFPYEETPGQLRAIADVKNDLRQNRPADRLICGDVGFGKTEVAIRAAFKVVESGKQVAVLCPTTVLAAQHHTTFTERLAAYPIRVELLSRFRSQAQQKETVRNLKAGATDIVIGTHRLLSRDVEFRNLGMVIIDEEQRFGVAQKERLKQLRKCVDVLTLTATPIPRTLSMALSGLRDLSVIEDPPGGRLPIVTHVREYDDELVRDAVMHEISRGGQVYYVHNRVETIDQVAMRVQRLVPDARLRIGHGQMSEDELERIMHGFYRQEYDVLVCTTIIENGLDIPNVNTIIVENADRMGLAQLYQLRGRVGRSSRQAYAYLLVPKGRMLTEESEQRLFAIREFTALGSGYQIAMRDLEIRGAGNLLGAEQSGAMSAVGFDMYCRLLAQAVAETRGEDYADETLPPADLPLTAHIPGDYIPNEAERIFFYKRMSGVTSLKDVEELLDELNDRYGDPPKPVWNALEVLRIRLLAKQAGMASVRHENRSIWLKFAPGVRLTARALNLLTHIYKDTRFTADSVVLSLSSPNVVAEVEDMLKVLGNALKDGSGRSAEVKA